MTDRYLTLMEGYGWTYYIEAQKILQEPRMKILMKWRNPYDEDANTAERNATNIANEEPSLTVQDGGETDLNSIVRRMGIGDGSVLPAGITETRPEYYGDFTTAPTSLRDALDIVNQAEDAFMSLPASVRRRFSNNPLNLWEWIQDPAHAEEAVEMKLLSRIPVPTPTEVNPPTPLPGVPDTK